MYGAVRKIPKGRVVTYGDIACMLKKPRAARAVGNALNHNVFSNVPCHRVVRSSGDIGGYAWGSPDKAVMLRREGVKMDNNHIDLKLYGSGRFYDHPEENSLKK